MTLKAGSKLAPLSSGIDFLGYVVYPRHTVVRRRVIGHCVSKLEKWRKSSSDTETLRSIWASYSGHFRHANSWRLHRRIDRRFPWLAGALRHDRASHL